MQVIHQNKKRKSIKIIRLKRQFRFISNVALNLMLLFSIILSSIVIYTKKYTVNTLIDEVSSKMINVVYMRNILDNAMFESDRVKINSLKYIKKSEIESIIEKSINCNYTSSIMREIFNKIKKIPFVHHITIKRNIFRSIELKIEEINIIAILKDKFTGKLFFIDENEKLIQYENQDIKDKNFPIIENLSIDDVGLHLELYQALLNCESIRKSIKIYTNISDRRWNLTLNNNTKIMLPKKDLEIAISKLCSLDAQVIPFTATDNIEYIDARIEDRVYYKNKELNQ